MNNDYEASKTPISNPDEWINDDSKVGRYRLVGASLGSLLALFILFNIELQCRLLKNSQGCGFDTAGQAIGVSTLMVIMLATLAGACGGAAANQHPVLRRFTICIGVLFFTFNFGWLGLSGWIVPPHQEALWKRYVDWAVVVIGLSYFVGLWCFNRKSKKAETKP